MTKIEWTNEVWNPVAGCSIKSSGCDNCYAMTMAYRLEKMGQAKYQGTTHKNASGRTLWTGKVNFDTVALLKPLSWKEPRRIFVNSMSDLFHENVTDDQINQVFAIMALAPQHTYQLLTKRPERMQDYIKTKGRNFLIGMSCGEIYYEHMDADDITPKIKKAYHNIDTAGWLLKNVWLGVSVEDQQTADERIPLLLDTPAAVRWISAEPLLGPIDLSDLNYSYFLEKAWTGKYAPHPNDPELRYDVLAGHMKGPDDIGLPKLDWVVVGGESGKDARPMHPEWVRSLRDQCQAATVPFFFKQWGEWVPGECAGAPPTRTEKCASYWNNLWDYEIITPRMHDTLHRDDEPDVYRVGKKKAGHHLDGQTHQHYPGAE